MEIPPQARGLGRSGPRRRTGCLTCRARKVRCDEAKPNCASCTRLRLQCAYKDVIIADTSARTSRARSISSATQEVENVSPGSNVAGNDAPGGGVGPIEQEMHGFITQQNTDLPMSLVDPMPDLQTPFDMLGFIGEITSDFQQKHLDLTNGGIIASSSIPELDGGIFSDERQMDWGSGMDDYEILPESNSRASTGEDIWEEQLLEHFRESVPPPTIFAPVDMEWKYVRSIMLAQSDGCRALLLAIYCYSDIHKAWIEGTQWRMGPAYQAQASSEIQESLSGEVSESVLKTTFTSVLLLMLAELISRENWRPSTPLLHTSYILLQRFHSRIQSWTGYAHLIISWVYLLDIKALIAGRDGDPLPDLGTLPSQRPSIEDALSGTLDDPLLTTPTYLIVHTITKPAFTFFLHTQQLTRRIIIIDLHHRTRGTVSDEFEVLQIAHTVSADLETLWNNRPKILDLYSSSNGQEEALWESLSPNLTRNIVRTFRSYVASFLALFIYLHRVAFAIYPRTDRVYRAVDQIIFLAKEESTRSIPVSFIWPLFIAALEGSIEQRTWIVNEIQQMAALGPRGGASRHPNAGKALVLLEEMTRRQDKSRTWADSKCVRRELFEDFFVML
ncbi:fungal-specific transcription factor domain-containing protein [Aspergillus crustosus]